MAYLTLKVQYISKYLTVVTLTIKTVICTLLWVVPQGQTVEGLTYFNDSEMSHTLNLYYYYYYSFFKLVDDKLSSLIKKTTLMNQKGSVYII